MALIEPSVLANSIMAKLYDILTNGDDTVPKSEDNFFSWCTPGIPIDEDELQFLTQGLTGVVKKAALDEMRTTAGDGSGNTASQPELTPEFLEALRAQDTAQLYMQAESFARLADFVPDLAEGTNEQFRQLSIMNNEGSLSERYEMVLRMSQVMKAELPEETKQKIEKLRGLLSVTKTKKNLIDDSETQVQEPSPLVQIYNEKLAAYENAALEYNSHRINALAADNTEAIHYWAMNANILRNRVKSAMQDWITNGYKNDYEEITAYIDQVMARDLSLLKQEYKDDLAKAKLTGMASGSDFYYTSLVPAGFFHSAGWTEFGFSASDIERYKSSSYKYSKSSTSSGASIFGYNVGGSVSSASGHSESHVQFSSDHTSLRFSIAQAQIVRPWFKTSFLTCKWWRFDPSNPVSQGQMLSGGSNPAEDLLPAYPTAIIFVKDLELFIAHSSGVEDIEASFKKSSAEGGGFIMFGPFHLGGSHSNSSRRGARSSEFHFDRNSMSIRVPGAQVIGFKCHILPKSPNPLETITEWI